MSNSKNVSNQAKRANVWTSEKQHLIMIVWPPNLYWIYDLWNSYFIYSGGHDRQVRLHSSKYFTFSSSSETRCSNVLQSETRENLGSLSSTIGYLYNFFIGICITIFSVFYVVLLQSYYITSAHNHSPCM